jgi:hypothetical protein
VAQYPAPNRGKGAGQWGSESGFELRTNGGK